jgi:amidohydrolase
LVKLLPEIAAAAPLLTEWRRDLHAHPEIAFQEVRTSSFVARQLEDWGIEVHRGLGGTGVVGVIRSDAPGPSIGLRADMDALPMQEGTSLPYRSKTDGAFHGCGHDGHTTMLLGAAQYLAQKRPRSGTVHLIFQPAEENTQGAERMLAEGLFERFPCDEIYGFHNMPLLEPGTAGVRTGATLSSVADYEITVGGIGGHGAAPHTTVDPLQTAARLAIEISSIVGRYVDPMQAAVITVGELQAGTAPNITPASAVLRGTFRTLSKTAQTVIRDRLKLLCEGQALASGCTIVCDVRNMVPPVENDATTSARAVAACAEVLGPDKVRTDQPAYPFADDFAFYLDRCPGTYIFLGQSGAMCHHPQFDFDDRLLPVGASIFARIVEQRLGAAANQ